MAVISNSFLRVNEIGTNGDFWDTLRCKDHGYPEQDLFLAVLKDALLSYRKNLHRSNKAFRADHAWFFGNDTDRLFSFESVCAALGLSAEKIRQYIVAWEREGSMSEPNRMYVSDKLLEIPNGYRYRVGRNDSRFDSQSIVTPGHGAGEMKSARR